MAPPDRTPSTLLDRVFSEEPPAVQIVGLPESLNIRLSAFFAETTARRRIYWLLVALLRHQSVRTANAIAFDLFLALIPMLGLVAWAASEFLASDPEMLTSSSLLLDVTPSAVHQFLEQNFSTFSAGNMAPFAVLAAWWLSSSAFFTIISVFEETFDCKPRSYLQARGLSMGFALIGLLSLTISGTAGILLSFDFSSELASYLFILTGSWLQKALGALLSFLVLSGFLAFLYRYSIRRPQKKRRVWPGAFLAATLGSLASVGFGYYVGHVARYALFYGSLATIVILLFWLWLWCTMILLGAEVNIALEDLKELQGTSPPSSSPPTQESSTGSS